ncbi:MAG: hypothetical protein ABIX37_08340 [Gammaproteobacteria bacterium]
MSAFVRWLRDRRLPRIATVVITFLLPLTNVVSAAVVITTARGSGWRSAAVDVLASLGVLGLLIALTPNESGAPAAGTAVLGAVALWGGAVLVGGLLRRFRSVDLALQALVIATLLAVAGTDLLIPDARAYWLPVLQALIQSAGLPRADGLPPDWLATMAALMHGVIGASLLSTVILALILGLWLDRDAGDGAEWRRQFLTLRLGRVLSIAAALSAVLVFAGFTSLGGGFLLVLGTGFAAQGMAIIHWTAEDRRWPRMWPLALYAPLLWPPSVGLVLAGLAVAGLVDNGVSLRRRRTDVV